MDISDTAERIMARVVFEKTKIKNTVNKNGGKFIRKIALDGLRQVIRQSPVDTGRFKANWGSSVGTMDASTTEDTSANFGKQSQGISQYKLGQTMFLHNNLQYALPLEYGSSKQAAKGWIRNTALSMQRKLNQIKDLI